MIGNRRGLPHAPRDARTPAAARTLPLRSVTMSTSRCSPTAILFASFWIVAKRSCRTSDDGLDSDANVSIAARSVGESVISVEIRRSSSSFPRSRFDSVFWCFASVSASLRSVCRLTDTLRTRNAERNGDDGERRAEKDELGADAHGAEA